MKRILILLLSVVSLAGCATNPQRTLASAQDVIYGAKKSWVAYLQAEYKRLDSLPAEQQIPLRDALKAKRDRVKELSVQVDAAWWAAWSEAKYNTKFSAPADLLKLVANLKLAMAP